MIDNSPSLVAFWGDRWIQGSKPPCLSVYGKQRGLVTGCHSRGPIFNTIPLCLIIPLCAVRGKMGAKGACHGGKMSSIPHVPQAPITGHQTHPTNPLELTTSRASQDVSDPPSSDLILGISTEDKELFAPPKD